MKTILLVLTALLIGTGSFAKKTIKGDSNTILDGYRLSQIEENLYALSYENSPETFTIEVCPAVEECCYLLRGENIELMYVSNNLGFGLRKMPECSQSISTETYCRYLNNKAFKNQSLLTPKKKNTAKALGLIACFFPHVVNEASQELVFNPVKLNKEKKLAER